MLPVLAAAAVPSLAQLAEGALLGVSTYLAMRER